MKNTQRESIGTTINRFETMPDQNIATFNELFPTCSLTGFPSDFSVVIGEYNCGLRTVTINDTIILSHEFSLIDYTLSDIVVKRFMLTHLDGETVGKFNSMEHASRETGLPTYVIKRHIESGRFKYEELTNE